MKKLDRIFYCVAFVVGIVIASSCLSQHHCQNSPEPAVPAPGEMEEGEPYSIATNGNIRIQFNQNFLPEETSSLELIFDGNYLGFYQKDDLIFLPKPKTDIAVLKVKYLDEQMDLITTKTYTLSL